jgi:hypothetical protein
MMPPLVQSEVTVLAFVVDSSDQPSPRLVAGRYRLLGHVGRGGMGEVFRAHDEKSGFDLALKRFNLRATRVDDQQRFRREFHTLARLRHPRIVQAYDYGVDRDRPFYTMELVDGQELVQLSPLQWPSACAIMRDVASALAFLHTHRLLHRDVSPRNVRCDRQGRAKLLDFGMLTTMGVSHEVVGTLPSIAPEMLLGLPIDGRADLYGLGAMGYWLLTGRHPGRVRSLDELLRHGRRPPAPPSSVEPDIPPELDELILAMLSSEPIARPASAAAVIERLETVAELSRVPEIETARGYVHSAELVGRKREMSVARSRLQRATTSRGGALVIEGASGMGKTRLLREIELEAKLVGATVVRGRVEVEGPYALVRQLAEALIDTLPDALDRPHSTRVGQLLSPLELAESTGWSLVSAPGDADPRAERIELQAALSGWLTTFGSDKPIVLIVDDIQRADEASAAVLAGLAYAAHETKVLIVAALRTDEPVRAGPAVQKLREQAVVLKARGLSEAEVETLLGTVFGQAQALGRLAASVHSVTSGSPLLCIELVRHLVEQRVVRYEGGMWVVPDRVDESALPKHLDEAMDARIASLQPRARELAMALAVHGGALALAQCVRLSGKEDTSDREGGGPRDGFAGVGGGPARPSREMIEDGTFAALDELVERGVVIGSEVGYRMAHDGLVEATLRALPADDRAALELRVGELLLKQGSDSPAVEARIGWHFVRGGDRERGGRYLTRSARRLFEATSFDDAVPQLEAAIEIHRERGSSPRVLAELYAMVITAGFYANRGATVRHVDAALDLLARLSGLRWGRALQKVLGSTLGLFAGLAIAMVVYVVRGRATVPWPVDALRDYARCLAYSAGVAGFSFDTQGLVQAKQRAEPFVHVRPPELQAVATFIGNLLNFNLGRLGTLMATSDRSLQMFADAKHGVTEVERDTGIGGARFQRGLAKVRTGNPDALSEVQALESLNNRLWDLGALQLRTYYHMWRGEETTARKLRTKTEVEFLRLGSLWQLDAIHEPTSAIIGAYVGDVLALRRAIEGIERLVAGGLGYRQHLHTARAEYHRLRGELGEARACVRDALAALPGDEGLVRPWVLCAEADIELDAGEHEAARVAAERAMTLCEDAEYGQEPYWFRACRTLALAQAKCGDAEGALDRLEGLLEKAAKMRNPFIEGHIHEALALVAHADGQQRRAEEHVAAMEARLAPTHNPVLIARCERLRRKVRPDESVAPEDGDDDLVTEVVAEPTINAETLADMLTVLSGCHTSIARAQRSLELVLSASGAPRGFLFLVQDSLPRVAAPLHGEEPLPSVTTTVRRTLDEAARGGEFRPSSRFVAEEDYTAWVCRLLPLREGSETMALGAVVLHQPEGFLPKPPAALLEAVARRLYESGDAAPVGVSHA